jgi:hypothetical protein
MAANSSPVTLTYGLTTRVSFSTSPVLARPSAYGYRSIKVRLSGIGRKRGPWRNFEAVELATPEWVDRFNYRRLLKPWHPASNLKYLAVLDQPAMAA